MKTHNKVMVVLMAVIIAMSSSVGICQSPDAAATKTRQRFATKTANAEQGGVSEDAKKPVDNSGQKKGKNGEADSDKLAEVAEPSIQQAPVEGAVTNAGTTEAAATNRHEQPSEEADIVPYYNNFFNTYRLGPEDIISVSVFGQDRYSRSGIIIPPSGRISLALIPGGVFVNGKTVDEVSEVIKKSYDEYIIDPQVSVSLDKASSYRYSVIGDVSQPGNSFNESPADCD